MAIVLSGHGLACGDGFPPFALPRGFTLYFRTADGIPIRDNVAGRIEADPPLTINPTPSPHTPLIAGAGDVWRLSEIMASYEAKGWGDINNPTPVH